MNKPILIIGSSGYIGSALYSKFNKIEYPIIGVDIVPSELQHMQKVMDYDDLTVQELEGYKSIILLAGNSSVKSCEGEFEPVFNNNVSKFARLLDKLIQLKSPPDSVLYASSASVYGRTINPTVLSYENSALSYPINHYDLTKQLIDSISSVYMNKLKLYGLRFGTVCGFSNNMRWDTIINSMFKSYKTTNQVIYSSGNDYRAILSMADLFRATKQLIDEHHTIPSGIYNIHSFNSTIGEIAHEVYYNLYSLESEIVHNRRPQLLENKCEKTSAYSFRLDGSKLAKHFLIQDSLKNIIDDLNDNITFI